MEGKRSGCHRTDGWGEQKRQNCQANPTPPIPQGGPCGLQGQLAQCCESSAAPADTHGPAQAERTVPLDAPESESLPVAQPRLRPPPPPGKAAAWTSWQGWCRGSRSVGLVRVLPAPPPPGSRGQAVTGQTRGAALPRWLAAVPQWASCSRRLLGGPRVRCAIFSQVF